MRSNPRHAVRPLRPVDDRTQDHQISNRFTVYQVRKKLETKGQGTVGFRFQAKQRFRIQYRCACSSLLVDVGVNSSSFRLITRGEPDRILHEVHRGEVNTDPFLDQGRMQTYWLSIDKNNNLMRFGKGEMVAETCEMEIDIAAYRSVSEVDWIATLDQFSIAGQFSEEELKAIKPVYRRLPVTSSAPPIIVARDQIDLGSIDNNQATVVDNLSAECAQLYNNVAGRNLSLNTADFSDFSDAINYSIITEGALCNTRLKEKSANLSEDRKRQCYLRITVGENLGDSPGAPYVLEIWPGQHYSPIHRHAECNAIIKVLHGSLSCRWFRSLQFEEDRPYQQSVLTAGQVTWLEPGQFQTHQLYNHNIAGNMCATIQCYKYSKSDAQHYEFFDYLNEDAQEVCQFYPSADWRYSEFKALIRAEWDAYKNSLKRCTIGGLNFEDQMKAAITC